jgi:hypothetical protein
MFTSEFTSSKEEDTSKLLEYEICLSFLGGVSNIEEDLSVEEAGVTEVSEGCNVFCAVESITVRVVVGEKWNRFVVEEELGEGREGGEGWGVETGL